MIEVKCFTFFATQKLHASDITKIVEDKHYPIIEIDGLELSPSIRLTCTNPNINEFDADDMLGGFFSDLFDSINNEIIEEDGNVIIKSIFVLQFDVDCPISLHGDEITYKEGERDYSYKVSPSFCRTDFPPLTDSIEIKSEKKLTIEEAVKELIM
ncbi:MULTISPECIES: hypothetical protein [Shewanella]|uniref:Uncharacterized protein n=3 Tax=Bacteria TaxID=2 RepID=A0AAU6VL61_UNCXX|nr:MULTISPECIES: hypothetical protein [Shewanella]AYV13332.1 hypothetical protein EEY24_10785 [Shewanella algae]MCE9777843.1 hypothetical protein [Shewanella algae]MCE9824468.1 hypothetical protein [Shewanella algae]MCT8980043.1 hypothetical protein [Shewanella algae]MDE0565280.1 hypothetical protein [Shewanella sp. K8]